MTFSEMMYYAEAEGLLPTRMGQINAVINDINALPQSTIAINVFERILQNHGLSLNLLTTSELCYIEEKIR